MEFIGARLCVFLLLAFLNPNTAEKTPGVGRDEGRFGRMPRLSSLRTARYDDNGQKGLAGESRIAIEPTAKKAALIWPCDCV